MVPTNTLVCVYVHVYHRTNGTTTWDQPTTSSSQRWVGGGLHVFAETGRGGVVAIRVSRGRATAHVAWTGALGAPPPLSSGSFFLPSTWSCVLPSCRQFTQNGLPAGVHVGQVHPRAAQLPDFDILHRPSAPAGLCEFCSSRVVRGRTRPDRSMAALLSRPHRCFSMCPAGRLFVCVPIIRRSLPRSHRPMFSLPRPSYVLGRWPCTKSGGRVATRSSSLSQAPWPSRSRASATSVMSTLAPAGPHRA
jgi:hypothetical protein